jgi:hypothetical protein
MLALHPGYVELAVDLITWPALFSVWRRLVLYPTLRDVAFVITSVGVPSTQHTSSRKSSHLLVNLCSHDQWL